MKPNSWKQVWLSKHIDHDKLTLKDQVILSGYDTIFNNIDEHDFVNYFEDLYRNRFPVINSIYEVGCGCGLTLHNFNHKVDKLGGLDYSKRFIEVCKILYPDFNDNFECKEACDLTGYKDHDLVVANQSFNYFNDLEYAKDVLLKMIQKSKKGVIVSGIPDIETYEESERFRRSLYTDYDARYHDLKVLYFSKQWFIDCVSKLGEVTFSKSYLPGFLQNDYRFNCEIKTL